MTDPIAPHSGPISAYMSVHAATNLAYVRYFGNKDNAESATFKSINSRGFTVSYKLPGDTQEQDLFIEFKTPLTKREQIRPVLEEMAKEAESALGLPSSLAGPPPIQAIAKALYAQATDVYTPPQPAVPLDTFIPADPMWQILIGLGMGATTVLALSSDDYLLRQFPAFVLSFRQAIGHNTIQHIFRGAVAVHITEGLVALGICLRRGWYSPINVFKWTTSTLLFGFASMTKLLLHAKQVNGTKTD